MKARFLQYFFKRNNTQGLNLPGLLLRIFLYSGIFVNLLLPFYSFRSNSFSWWDDSFEEDGYSAVKNYMDLVSRGQSNYYLKHGNFSHSIDYLNLKIIGEIDKYTYRILSPMVPMQTSDKQGETAPEPEIVVMLAQAKFPTLKSYMAMVSTLKQKDSHNVLFVTAICEINSLTPLPSTMPTLTDGQIQCPNGSQKVTVIRP